jgi:pSer/pThr/pTyr-binding forkhead associated (FHA) protein
MKLSLEVLTEGKQKGKRLPISLSQFLIGRDVQCHLRPASPLISNRHCAVIQRDDKVFVRDFDSTNGTFVNDQPVKGEVELKHNDHLKVGPIAFTVMIEAASAVNRPTPPPPTKPVTTTAKPGVNPNDETKIPVKKSSGEVKKVKAKPAAPVPDSGNNEDDIAAMLMSLQDDTDGNGTSGYVPEGSTVMDLPLPPGVAPPGGGEPVQSEADKEKEKSKQHQGNTSSAAKSILEKMMRRPRT